MAPTIPSATAETNALTQSATVTKIFPLTAASTATGPFPTTFSSVARIAEEPFVPVSASSDDEGAEGRQRTVTCQPATLYSRHINSCGCHVNVQSYHMRIHQITTNISPSIITTLSWCISPIKKRADIKEKREPILTCYKHTLVAGVNRYTLIKWK